MTNFLHENSLFIMSLGFLAALVAGASALQATHESTHAPQTLSSNAEATQWHIAPASTSASTHAETVAPSAPKAGASAVSKPRPRVYNEEDDD